MSRAAPKKRASLPLRPPTDLRKPNAWHRLAYIVEALPVGLEELARELEVPADGRVLDYGCADQPYRRFFPPSIDYTGADLRGNPAASLEVAPDGTLPVADEGATTSCFRRRCWSMCVIPRSIWPSACACSARRPAPPVDPRDNGLPPRSGRLLALDGGGAEARRRASRLQHRSLRGHHGPRGHRASNSCRTPSTGVCPGACSPCSPSSCSGLRGCSTGTKAMRAVA